MFGTVPPLLRFFNNSITLKPPYDTEGPKTQSENWERDCLSCAITYKKNNPGAKMKNKNIRYIHMERSRKRAWTQMIGKKICPVKRILPVFLGDDIKQTQYEIELTGKMKLLEC